MTARKRAIIIAAVTLVALLLSAAAVQAHAIITTFTGTEGPCSVIEQGDWITLPSGNLHVRGMVVRCRDEMLDSRATGYNTIVVNGNWDPIGDGPVWGTAELQVDGGGSWAATWAGTKTGPVYTVHAEGDGVGIYAGMKYWMEGPTNDLRGRILDPHGGE